MTVIAPNHETANRFLFNRVQLRHQLRKQVLACFVEKGPPALASSGVKNANAVWPSSDAVGNFKSTEQMFFTLQPFPCSQGGGSNGWIAKGARGPSSSSSMAPGLDKTIASVWSGVPVQGCTVHNHRNLFAHAPERLHGEITAVSNDMIYATTPEEIETRREGFIRKWRLKHRAVADSLEEAGERLFTFMRLPPSPRRSLRTTNAIEPLHEEFKRRIMTRNRAAVSRHRCHVVLGTARLRSDQHPQG